ncbi:MAG: ATP-binding protein, partial [Acidimicrobiia bacterium]|nr:ATP-binding protein [Acidimicrobiia bacterium]
SSGESLLTLVNDLLDHSKLEAGKLSLDSVGFDLAHMVRDTIKTLDLAATEKGLTTSYSVDPEVQAVVVGDPGRIRQVLVNLVANAVKFTHDGGVAVSVSVESVSSTRAVIRFAVEDTGIGMSQEQANAVFRPFEQAGPSVGRVYGGTGLGLTICQRLVELMGGRIWIESAEGQGSTFFFTVEVGTEVPKRDHDSEMPTDRSELEVVVLTDSERRSMTEGLAGARVRTIHLGSSAETTDALIPALQKKRAHIVILDFRDQSLQAAAGVLPVSGEAKIVILTPSGQRGDAARCRELDISAYLTGSVTSADISSAIDAVVEGVPGLITRHWLRERRTGAAA